MGEVGRIVADGGHGGGENTSLFNRVGGGSGGGAGNGNQGGARQAGPVRRYCDYIPQLWLEPADGAFMPQRTRTCHTHQPNFGDFVGGPTQGAGGDGGPGVIQVHVDDPAVDFLLSGVNAGGSLTCGGTDNTGVDAVDASLVFTPPPHGWAGPMSPVDRFLPFFGGLSIAQSDWILLGLARLGPGGLDGQVNFEFAGIEADDMAAEPGAVRRTGSVVNQVSAIIGPDPLGSGGAPRVDNGGLTLVFDATLLPDIYKAGAVLTKFFSIEQDDTVSAQRFEVVDSVYSATTDQLICAIVSTNDDLADYIAAASGVVTAALVRHDFRMVTSGSGTATRTPPRCAFSSM